MSCDNELGVRGKGRESRCDKEEDEEEEEV